MTTEPPLQPDESSSRTFGSLRTWRGDLALKGLIVSIAGLIVGFGTCSMGGVFRQGQLFLTLGITVFLISVLGVVVSSLWLLVAVIAREVKR